MGQFSTDSHEKVQESNESFQFFIAFYGDPFLNCVAMES